MQGLARPALTKGRFRRADGHRATLAKHTARLAVQQALVSEMLHAGRSDKGYGHDAADAHQDHRNKRRDRIESRFGRLEGLAAHATRPDRRPGVFLSALASAANRSVLALSQGYVLTLRTTSRSSGAMQLGCQPVAGPTW